MTEFIFFGGLIMLFIILVPHMRHPLKENTYWMDVNDNVVKIIGVGDDELGITRIHFKSINDYRTMKLTEDAFLKLYKKIN